MLDFSKCLRLFQSSSIPGDETATLRKFYAVAVGIMGCFTVCMQLLIGSLLSIQERETEAVILAGQEQLLGEQSARAATEIVGQNTVNPEKVARLVGLLEEWCESRLTLGAGLGFQTQSAFPLAGIDPVLLGTVKDGLSSDPAELNSEMVRALADSVVAAQPPLLQSSSQLIALRLARAQVDKTELRSTGMVVGAVMVLVLGMQTWRGFGEALRILGVQRAREATVLQEVQLARDTISRMTRQQELILNSAGEAIWGVDERGHTTFVNPAASKVTGWKGEELLGRSQHEMLRHCDKNGAPFDDHSCPVCRAFRDGQEHHSSDDMFHRQDGTCFPVECHSMPIREDGEIVGAVLTFKDISENRALQSNLMQTQKLESIGQLAAGIAHEINTPTQYVSDNTRFLKDAFSSFGKVVGMCERLVAAAKQHELSEDLIAEATAVADEADLEYLNEEVPKAIDQSLEGLGRVARIVSAMKEFSHPDGDAKQLTDLNRAIQSTVTVARNEWKYVADVELDLDPDLPLIHCLAGSLNQVVLNLVVNAAHAIGDVVRDTQSKGTIGVATRRDGDYVSIRISDTGKGIPTAIRERVFDPFFTTKPVGKGTGQGLAIAYSVVVDKHGGSISFESEEGRGTTFHIRLPLQPEATEQGAECETTDCAG
jgi:PAS domain S-box-containing protein